MDAIDLAGITEIAELVDQAPGDILQAVRPSTPNNRLLLDLVLTMRQSFRAKLEAYRAEDRPGVLDALDNRTKALEELTKFLSTPLGVVVIMASTGARATALVRALRLLLPNRHCRFGGQWQSLHNAIWHPGKGRRVPPRVYLTRHGHVLTSLHGSSRAGA
jgi:hypothetical protein